MDLNTTFFHVRQASTLLATLDDKKIAKALLTLAATIEQSTKYILQENEKDLALLDDANPKKDRVRLTRERIDDIVKSIREIADMPSPVGRILHQHTHANGMKIAKVSVPFGVIGAIFEARPNVAIDVFTLCFKSHNACLLKGGSDASFSNEAIINVIHKALRNAKIDENVVALLPAGHEAAEEMMKAREYVDLIIPRGGRGLINYVRENSRVPIIETGAGICHTYFDFYGYTRTGADVIFNAKTRRVSVCNALDCLIMHSGRLAELPELCERLAEKSVRIYADERAYEALEGHYPAELLLHATEESFGTEFLDYAMAIKTVDDFFEAVDHIAKYGSHHSECIVTENKKYADLFRTTVDAACIYNNVSTAFTDGGQFGLGAEIGISTQKLHARGPMGLEEITTYKWFINGDGQTRE